MAIHDGIYIYDLLFVAREDRNTIQVMAWVREASWYYDSNGLMTNRKKKPNKRTKLKGSLN